MLTDKSCGQDKDSGIFLLGVIFYKSSRGKIRKMSRAKRELIPGYSYHITIRCNNREFRLTRLECRQVLLYAIKKAIEKYGFKLYALCVMSNHIHYLIEPKDAEDLPKIMHWLNWYTAMCFNRMLNRTGHFWEKRYHSSGFPTTDTKRALNTLRYIHANPKAAGVQVGFFYDFSDYGVYDRLGDDGLTTWHPAFLSLGETLEECAAKYRGFCKKYRPRPKPETRNHWGSKLLAGIKPKKRSKKSSPGQLSLWEDWEEVTPEILAVADQFVFANAYNPRVAGDILQSCRRPDAGPG
jgi:putative transposase